MKNLQSKIINRRTDFLSYLVGGEVVVMDKHIFFDIDDSVTRFEKAYIKDYALKEVFSFSERFGYMFDFELIDYGYPESKDYLVKNYGNGELILKISDYDFKNSEVTLTGGICADIMALSDSGIAKFKVWGINKDALKYLKVYQELILEAERLYDEDSYKMSFFVYFSAIEAVILSHVELYKDKIHPELHDALEYLSLDEKLKLAVRESYIGKDFTQAETWGEMMGGVRSVKDKRNLIAHGRKVEVNEDDVKDVLLCLVFIVGALEAQIYTFNGINRAVFPRTRKK